jgi:hypothetical protein
MSFLEKLLEAGAPWWVVVGLIVLVVAAALLAAVLAPDLLRPLVRRGAMQPPNVIIHNHDPDTPFERASRGLSGSVAGSSWGLAQELDMLKSDGDEVYIHDLPPEQA